eukprot:scaffold92011_cov26-Prasinocladus_malaysianus.AAC.1
METAFPGCNHQRGGARARVLKVDPRSGYARVLIQVDLDTCVFAPPAIRSVTNMRLSQSVNFSD